MSTVSLPLRIAALVLLALTGPAGAAEVSPAPLHPSADGREVIDTRAGSAWPRCVEGMAWNGRTCTGTPHLMRHNEALALAAQRSRETGQRWRLPRVPELRRLAGRHGLDARLFPAAPPDWHWSATIVTEQKTVNPYSYANVMKAAQGDGPPPPASSFVNGWAVNLMDGESRGDVPRGSRLVVRLVRQADAPPAKPAD
jgi:hypothetical protein